MSKDTRGKKAVRHTAKSLGICILLAFIGLLIYGGIMKPAFGIALLVFILVFIIGIPVCTGIWLLIEWAWDK